VPRTNPGALQESIFADRIRDQLQLLHPKFLPSFFFRLHLFTLDRDRQITRPVCR
jgi:hypothetical protein